MWKLKVKKSSPYGVAAAVQRRVNKIELGEDGPKMKVDLNSSEGRSLIGYNYLEWVD
jgi:hypothetical protein|tara:strand:+ start:512 stop:682 length:171 start_codon:yes stop_codon:yes gene_type:complete